MTPELQEEIARAIYEAETGPATWEAIDDDDVRAWYRAYARATAPIIARLVAEAWEDAAAVCEDRFAMNGWAVVAAIRARKPQP